ncbi:hypothetical protein THRCLA_20167 [Thraustotheca clavata]|uniref:BAH domain-containing protein n=1 Tax=Thraustotheca clavata TaxID=74557 RepID=A0A1W0AAU3_9STRA|nr:hypothetical protein THRCLA_20167 [Thraustotheca clavata]
MDGGTDGRRRVILPREARNVASYSDDLIMDTYERKTKRTKTSAQEAPVPSRKAVPSDSEVDSDNDNKIEAGDCIIVDSGAEYDYIALVVALHYSPRSSSIPISFTGQWFYRPEDIPADILAKVGTAVLQSEVFLSNQRDRNAFENIREKCKVVSALAFQDRLNVIRNGHEIDSDDDEKTFICRFRYDPENKETPFIALKEHEIRFGAVAQANIGDEFQVGPLPMVNKEIRQQYLAECKDRPHPRAMHMWSPTTMNLQPFLFKKYLNMVDVIRFGVGNVVKTFRKGTPSYPITAQLRGIVCTYNADDTVGLCTSDGKNTSNVKKSDLISVLTDDRVMHHFHATNCNVSQAIHRCTTEYIALQEYERKLFRREVEINISKST